MAFDQGTRNRLQRLVSDCRATLTNEFTLQLQQDYGLDPKTGEVTELSRLTHLSDRERHTAALLRETLAHYLSSALAGESESKAQRQAAIDRIIREQAFTVLNRLAALLMMEARGLLLPAVSQGAQSQAFELYRHVAGTALGETGEVYQAFLFSLFDEFALDLPALFDRFAPQGRLFPRETALNELLALLNDYEIEPLWALDETIGWVYQYFNSQEERKAMRKASQAPRNSRELAVRNQFFTPRYVVEFLVDNTLGRQWFNATGGTTPLRDSCQYLLVKPDEQPEAGIKLRDPRTLKLLDPACGSMHFGLYAFDLFLQIYRDAWQWEQQHGPGSLDLSTQPEAGFEPLCHTYADEEALLRDVPRLIIEHNIYGVDIDPRAAQIASMALWLRAQRAWHEAGVPADKRPDVGQGNVIAAVAPPAEKELREAFAARLDSQDAELFEKTLQMLKGLPELGVLLRAEKELPALIRQVYVGKGSDLFAEQEQETWQKAEKRLRRALLEFSEEAGVTYQSRLFAQDALQGLRMIDLCREAFDVVLMNPPFGAPTPSSYQYIRDNYSGSHSDVYASFVARACGLAETGYVGCISSRSFLIAPRLDNFRKEIVIPRISALADFGLGVMDDARVEAAAFILGEKKSDKFFTIDARKEKGEFSESLKQAAGSGEARECSRGWFYSVPKHRMLYGAPAAVREAISSGSYFEPQVGTAREGMKSFDNFRFVRLWWEVEPEKIGKGLRWVRFCKGGSFSYFYQDILLVLNWASDGAELKEVNKILNGSTAQVRQASSYWYRPGVTYSKRSSKGFSARALPGGYIFTSNGPAVLSQSDVPVEYILGWLNSRLVRGFLHLQANFGDYSTGAIKKLPWVDPDEDTLQSVVELTNQAVGANIRHSSNFNEVSPVFSGADYSRGLQGVYEQFLSSFENINKHESRAIKLSTDKISSLYGVESIDWTNEILGEEVLPEDACGLEVSDEGKNLDLAEKLVSYAVGCVFLRWDCSVSSDLKTETCGVSFSSTFSDIPQVPPAYFNGSSSSGVSKEFSKLACSSGVAEGGDRSGNELSYKVRGCLENLFKDRGGSWEVSLCESLGVTGVEEYLNRVNNFFDDHLSVYSGSSRQAPIYWPLATASGSYILWLYYPDLTDQTLFTAVNDFVDPKLKQVDSELGNLRLAGASRSRKDEKCLEELSDFRDELADLCDTLLRIAPNYKPNHDDGVQITAAPLWPLFRHKPWQKVLKETWEKLEKGDYDWAHLAMAYWPERVREKCVTDKSFAIAHDLEHLYVEPEPAPKKTRGRKKSTGSGE